ncbi:MAG: uracil-DNA glycosylase [Bacteroidetes bacterium]|nr:uracil-DNA glycosylase [Bacteroidota bacterium]MBS1630587.1 uracil-DNA glycosylase [Bacteroidota bacterium]
MVEVRIAEDWKQALNQEFAQAYFEEIVRFLKKEKQLGKTIYPEGSNIFYAFDSTPLRSIKVVILGQDPYHGPGQAHGLSFSVPRGIAPPRSLMNIFQELASDTGLSRPQHGNLESWAAQGVLLLNASLTVEAHQANSHAQIGWHQFTDAVIQKISEACAHVVFILWGRFAQGKIPLIDSSKHFIICSVHPSPFSADRGFFGSRPFSRANEWLALRGIQPIDWSLPK